MTLRVKFALLTFAKNFFLLRTNTTLRAFRGLTWHVIGHASAFAQGEVRKAFHLAILLRINLIELQLPFVGEVAMTNARSVVLQTFRSRHHVRLHRDDHFLVQRRSKVLLANPWNLRRIVQEDLETFEDYARRGWELGIP